MKRKQTLKPTLGRRVMKLICLALAVILGVMVGVTAYFQNLINREKLLRKKPGRC